MKSLPFYIPPARKSYPRIVHYREYPREFFFALRADTPLRTPAITDKIQPPRRKLWCLTWLPLLRTLYQHNNFIVLTLAMKQTPCFSPCVNLYKHTSKDYRNVYFRIDLLVQDLAFSLWATLLAPFPSRLWLFNGTFFFSHPLLRTLAISDTKLHPAEGLLFYESWL